MNQFINVNAVSLSNKGLARMPRYGCYKRRVKKLKIAVSIQMLLLLHLVAARCHKILNKNMPTILASCDDAIKYPLYKDELAIKFECIRR
ncbi:hypothetical protein P856_500 [Candidatus Endolissoclinum faulkneri L5]|uniref:Uncharacterized protein n=1 Tax=Candidatus Endolissoclinum faulkneri L5 TaxID=1401328 RepID=V9TU97_9PROT|nr:hypothetical protein P856_500 [Candidatus Endolissoclinum faulkneri L5]